MSFGKMLSGAKRKSVSRGKFHPPRTSSSSKKFRFFSEFNLPRKFASGIDSKVDFGNAENGFFLFSCKMCRHQWVASLRRRLYVTRRHKASQGVTTTTMTYGTDKPRIDVTGLFLKQKWSKNGSLELVIAMFRRLLQAECCVESTLELLFITLRERLAAFNNLKTPVGVTAMHVWHLWNRTRWVKPASIRHEILSANLFH